MNPTVDGAWRHEGVPPGSLVLGFPKCRRLTGTEERRNMKRLSGIFGLVLACACGLGVTACGDDDDNNAPAPGKADIEVKGTWTNADFGDVETDVINDTSWSAQYGDSDPSVSTIVEYSNDTRSAVILTPDAASFNPSTYSNYVWTKPAGGVFYYCSASYGCASADQAKNGPADDTCTLSDVDDSDPANSGCGTFAWTKLTAQ